MKKFLIILSVFLLFSCDKSYPILTGKVTVQSSKTGEIEEANRALLDIYEYNFTADYDSISKTKSLYHTSTNENGKYRIDHIEIGSYLVVVQATVDGKESKDYQKIDIDRKKNYECNFHILY